MHRRMNETFGAASHIKSHKWSIQVKSESVLLLGQHADVLQSTVGAGFPSINSTVRRKKKKKEFNPYLLVPITLQLWHADPSSK